MKNRKKMTAVVVSLLLILCMGAGGTLAYLIDKTDPKINTFEAGYVEPTIHEEFPDHQVKSNVKIENTGNVDAYIRAALVVTWQKKGENGETYIAPYAPVLRTDYSMTLNIPENAGREDNVDGSWFLAADGFYYFSKAVAPDKLTDTLVVEAKQEKANADGYTLHLEILSSTIQSDWNGTDVTKHPAAQHWGVTVNADGTISKS